MAAPPVLDRDIALSLAREARALPKDVGWFYLRALRSAVRRGEVSSIGDADKPAAISKLLEAAGASQRVVTLGGGSAVSAIALAIDDRSRKVTVVHPLAPRWERDDYMQFVDVNARARIDFCSRPVRPLPEGLREPDLVVDIDALIRLDGADVAGLRSPSRKDVERLAATLGRPKRGAGRIALSGALAGLAAAVMLPASLSESLPGTSGNGNDLAPPQPQVESVRAQPKAAGAGAGDPAPQGTLRAGARATPSHLPLSERKPGAGTLSGRGDRRLGTLRVDRPTALRWNAGRSLKVVSQDWNFRARPGAGSTVLTPGTYLRFAVRSDGRWKLKLERAR
jgi:hypothetical protein